MEAILTVCNPLQYIATIQIFKPYIDSNGAFMYPVNIDSLPTMFQKEGSVWRAIKHATFISEDLGLYISNLIESVEL